MPEDHVPRRDVGNRGHGLVKIEMRVTLGVGARASISLSITHRVDTGEVGVVDVCVPVQ